MRQELEAERRQSPGVQHRAPKDKSQKYLAQYLFGLLNTWLLREAGVEGLGVSVC